MTQCDAGHGEIADRVETIGGFKLYLPPETRPGGRELSDRKSPLPSLGRGEGGGGWTSPSSD